MNPQQTDPTVSRRDFVKTAAIAAVAASGIQLSAQTARGADAPATSPSSKPLIGFQVEVSYIMQYGIAAFLDDVQNRAAVNAIFLHSNLFEPSGGGGRGSATLGKFATAHPQYYSDIGMRPQALAAGEFNLPDAMEKISAETKKRGVKIFSWMEEDNRPRPLIEGFDQLYEVDLYGRRTQAHPGGPCLNNPHFRNLIAAQIEDYLKSYPIDGLQRGSERQGPLGNAMGAWHHGAGARSDPGHTSCFCDYCATKAAKLGIDFDKVKKAFLALEPYVRDGRAGKRPRDGYYVEFWRLLLRHPELLVWETFWSDSMREMQREFYTRAKSIRPDVEIGFHIWHNIAFNPMYRAEQDYQPYTEYSDFLKPVIYDNCAAERMASFIDSVGQNYYGDMSKEQALQFDYSVMDLKEKTYAEIHANRANNAFSADYVYGETKRAVDGVAGSKTRICPGLGIDVQLPNSTPESVKNAVNAIFRAGGQGMVISTSHAAMKPENLSAAGAVLRELKVV